MTAESYVAIIKVFLDMFRQKPMFALFLALDYSLSKIAVIYGATLMMNTSKKLGSLSSVKMSSMFGEK